MAARPGPGARAIAPDPSVLEAVLDATEDLVVVVDPAGRALLVNRAACAALGVPPGDDPGPGAAASLFSAASWWVLEAEAIPAAARGEVWRGELAVRVAPGRGEVPVPVMVLPGGDRTGEAGQVAVVARHPRAGWELEARLRHRADHDRLTGLPNREPLLARLADALVGLERYGTPVAVLFLDVDRFRVINDSLGHDAGDRLLVALARRLDATVRPHDRLGRFGADEFVVLCPGVGGAAEALEVAERVRRAVGGRFPIGPGRDTAGDHGEVGDRQEVFVTASVGVVLARPGDSPEGLLRDAEAALHEAKAAGRDRARLFDAAVRARLLERLDVERALRRALERDELRLHYQPIVDLASGEVRGVEALLRWGHPERGLLAPAAFLEVAEDTGLIVEFGRWVLTEACRLVAGVPSDAGGGSGLPVFVNLSARQLADPGLVPMVREVIELTGVEPARVHLEVTEDALLLDAEATTSTLAALRALGVRLALDDFGTGHSSLAYLKQFPVEVLKIDRAFVEGLDDDVADRAIIGAIVEVARVLGLEVVAEGVERAEQVEALAALGCGLAQGFHLARPVGAAELPGLLGDTSG